jgi:hypothetical protein
MTRQPRTLQCVLALFDPLLGHAPLVVEPHHVAGFPPEICHNETDSRKQFARMPLHFRNDPSSDLPTGRLIAKAMVKNNRLLPRTPYGTSEQMLDFAVQILIRYEADHDQSTRSSENASSVPGFDQCD